MSTSTLNKTADITLLALQQVAAAGVVVGAWQDVATKVGPARVNIHFGRRATGANTGQVRFRLEVSSKASGEGHSFPLYETSTVEAATACESEAATSTNASGQKVIGMASTTNLVAGDIVYIENTTVGNSEWGRIASVSLNTSITLEDNLSNAQSAGAATIFDRAEFISFEVDIAAATRIRLVADGASGPTTQGWAVQAEMITVDSVNIAA